MSSKVMKRIALAALMILMVCVMGCAMAETVETVSYVMPSAFGQTYAQEFFPKELGEQIDQDYINQTVTLEELNAKYSCAYEIDSEHAGYFAIQDDKTKLQFEVDAAGYLVMPVLRFKTANSTYADAATITTTLTDKTTSEVYTVKNTVKMAKRGNPVDDEMNVAPFIVQEGELLTLHCEYKDINGEAQNFTYEWSIPLGMVDGKPKVDVLPSNGTTCTFPIKSEYNGKRVVIAVHYNGKLVDNVAAQLTVLPTLSVTEEVKPAAVDGVITVTEGEQVQISVIPECSDSSIVMSYAWELGGTALENATGSYTFVPKLEQNGQIIKVEVSASADVIPQTATEFSYQLNVKALPTLSVEATTNPAAENGVITVKAGEQVQIEVTPTCSDSTVGMSYEWKLGGEKLNAAGNSYSFGTHVSHNGKTISVTVVPSTAVNAQTATTFTYTLNVQTDPADVYTENESAVVNGTPGILIAYPSNKNETSGREFASKYLGSLSNAELNAKYEFTLEADKSFQVIDSNLTFGAQPHPYANIKPISSAANGKSVKFIMSSKQTGAVLHVMEYVFTLKGERSVFDIKCSGEYTHKFVNGRGEVLTLVEGSDLSVTLGHKGIGQTLDVSYVWIDLENDKEIGTSNTLTLKDIRSATAFAVRAMTSSGPIEMIFFEVDVTPAPPVKVEEQTEEQKKNQTATVVLPESAIEHAIDYAKDDVVELPVAYAQVDEQTSVTAVKTTTEAFEAIAETEMAVSIPLDHAEVIMESEVVSQIAEKAEEGATIEIEVEQKQAEEALSNTQLQAVAGREVAAVITADVFMTKGDTRTKIPFSGEVTLKIPFDPPAGESGHDYVMIYVADNGTTETLPTYYEKDCLVTKVTHFSDFVIAKIGVQKPVEVPVTGDSATPYLWLLGMIIAAAGCTIILGKRRQNG